MLGFRPLDMAKRKLQQSYAPVPAYAHIDAADSNDEKCYDSDGDDSYTTETPISAYSSRASSSAYLPPRPAAKPRVSAYSYRNPRAFTRYLGLAIGTTLILFVFFLFKASWTSIRNVQMGISKPAAAPPVWESFPFLKRYHGGIRTLVSREKNMPEYPSNEDIDPDFPGGAEVQVSARAARDSVPPSDPFSPYPQYSSAAYLDEYGPVATCFLDANDTIRIPPLQVYNGVTEGMPTNVMGSYELLGLRDDVCFERFGRLGPYGLGYSRKYGGTGAAIEGDRQGSELVWKEHGEVDYRVVNWGEALDRCLERNSARFTPLPSGRDHLFQKMGTKGPAVDGAQTKEVRQAGGEKYTNGTTSTPPKAQHKKLLPRTAVLLRTWHDYHYDDEDLLFLRALIAELSIQSGGEFIVHFLIHVKDNDKQIWADEAVYQEVLASSLPPEFAGMGTLWSERQMSLIYGSLEETNFRGLPIYGAYRSTFMPVMYFAHQHPEFDFFWHWEMDVRYTGHYYHLLDRVGTWADKQPRKGLWERNARFYVPAKHGSWEEFMHLVRVQTEHGTNSAANKWSANLPPNPKMPEPETQKPEKPIWGPEPPLDFPDIQIDEAVKPPRTITEDKFEWGVGEPADLIVLNPLFDPDRTNWILAEDVTGYNKTQGLPPRRTAINTAGRLSRRLLMTMHNETTYHRHSMFSEMWPSSVALHHGLKAVYAPHPVFIDRKWPVDYLAAIFNNGRNGASGGSRLSVFSDERQHNFLGTTWYYHAGFAPNLWKRWLGYKVDNDGGEEEELAGEGRMCLPAMLLHPVKQVDLVIDHEGERIPSDGDTKR